MIVTTFTNQSKKDKNGNLKVYLRVTHNGSRFLVSTGITSVAPLKGSTFPRTEKNAKSKKARVDALIVAAETVCLNNPDASATRLKE